MKNLIIELKCTITKRGIDLDINEMLTKAMGIASSVKYFVRIGSEELKEMSYLELGIFITTKADEIETIDINLRDKIE